MVKIAIVEDNQTTRESLRTIIDLSPGCRCVCLCETAEEALTAIPKHSPDVVLMDIQLQKMSGVECVARLKELMPQVQVIMVTVYQDPDRIFRALRAGASGYLLKRAAPDMVLNAIRDVQQGGVPMSAEIARKVIGFFQTRPVAAPEVEKLSPRELEILNLIAPGFSNKEIADRLGISIESIRWHLKNIYHKLHVHSRTEAASKIRSRG
ncbi:MAG TPA: response regulator transcription factor [Verrucomicrobiae bacterium]|jgi:DNA-binding NarL/FixJ family response regulator|nr:response regulator transcription factor [Verrucomicrobiae bacterium]